MRRTNQRQRLTKCGNWNVYSEADLRSTRLSWQPICAFFPAGERATGWPESPLSTGWARHGSAERVRAPKTPLAREIFGRESGLSSAAHPPSSCAWAADVCHDPSGEGVRGTGVLISQSWPCGRTWGNDNARSDDCGYELGGRILDAPACQAILREAPAKPREWRRH